MKKEENKIVRTKSKEVIIEDKALLEALAKLDKGFQTIENGIVKAKYQNELLIEEWQPVGYKIEFSVIGYHYEKIDDNHSNRVYGPFKIYIPIDELMENTRTSSKLELAKLLAHNSKMTIEKVDNLDGTYTTISIEFDKD